MHYGHPDVFDRIFHLTRGGFSKASKAINVSEDIYAGLHGYNFYVPSDECFISDMSACYRFQHYLKKGKCYPSRIYPGLCVYS